MTPRCQARFTCSVLGKCVRRALRSSAAYVVLDSDPGTTGTTFMQGGCWLAAEAIRVATGAELGCLVKDGQMQHAFGVIGDCALDADGGTPLATYPRTYARREGLAEIFRATSFDAELQRRTHELQSPPRPSRSAVMALADVIDQALLSEEKSAMRRCSR